MVATIFLLFYVSTFAPGVIGALPKLKSVSFDENFEKLILKWDKDIKLNVSYRDCSAILTNKSMQILGNSPVCLMTSYKELAIIPGMDAPIKMDNSIGMNPKYFAPGNVTIDGIAPFPNIVLKGPKKTCPCTSHYIYYNIDFSTLAGYGRLRSIVWGNGDGGYKPVDKKKEDKDKDEDKDKKKITLLPPDIDFPLIILAPPTITATLPTTTTQAPTPPTTPAQEIETLETTYGKYNGLQEIRINSSLFEINGTYIMDVDAKNVLGERGSYQWHVKPQEECKPFSNIHQGSTWNMLGPIVFYVTLSYPACWSGDKIPTYEWSVSEKVQYNTSSYLFYIEENVLESDKLYTVTAKAKFKKFESNDTISVSSYVSFKVDMQPLHTRILGDYIEAGWDGRLFLSNFVEDANAENVVPTYTWECQSNAMNRDKFLLASNRILDVSPKEKFNMTETYRCTFTYEKNKRKAEDSIDVKFVVGAKPILSVYSVKRTYCPKDKIFFTATLAGATINDDVKYTWDCYDKYDGRQTNILPSGLNRDGTTKVVVSGVKRQRFSTLEIPKNTIPFGVTLTCRCQIRYNNVILSATDSVVIDMHLRHTILSVYPENGYVIETPFRARAHSWTLFGANKPLKFRFGYRRNVNDTIRYLSPWSSDNILDDIYFPKMDRNPATVEMVVEILNARKAKSIATTTIKLFLNQEPSIEMPDIEHHLEIDQFKASTYLYNYLSNMKDVAELTNDDHKLNKHIIKYLNTVVSAPMTSVGVENVFAFMNDLTNVTKGKVAKDVLINFQKVVSHITNELWNNVKEDIGYVKELKSMLPMFKRILKEESNYKYALSINDIHKLVYSYTAFACNSNPDIIMSPLTVSSSSISVSAFRGHHITSDVKSPLTLSPSLVDMYSKQYCQLDNPCHGYCFTDASFIPSQYLNNTPTEGNGKYITEFRDMRIWKVGGNGEKPVQITNTKERYLVYLDVTEKDVEQGDWIQCLVFGDTIETYMPSACQNATLIGGNGTYKVECDCSQIGLMAGYKPWTPPVILQPEPRLNYSFYFYAPAERCEKRLFDPFKPQFRALLKDAINAKEKEAGGELKMSAKRIQILSCKAGSIIIEFYILDDTTELRNSRIKEIVDEMIIEENFKVKLNKNIFPMFDPNQTTPKPPTPTIPIGEVTVDWIPIIIALGVVFGFFLLIACIICLYNTHLLKKNVFTEINSDKFDDKEEEEEDDEESIEMVDKKTRAITMIKIMEEELDTPEERKASRSALWKSGKSSSAKQVHPTNSTTTDFYHESAMLDTYRLALDDDESMSSRVMLFAAQQQGAKIDNPDPLDIYGGDDTSRSKSTQSYDVTVDNPLDAIAAPPDVQPTTTNDVDTGVDDTGVDVRIDSKAALSDNTVYELGPEETTGPAEDDGENNNAKSQASIKNQSKPSLKEQVMTSRATIKNQSQGSLSMHEIPPNAPDVLEPDSVEPQPDLNDVNIASSKVSVRSSAKADEPEPTDLINLNNGSDVSAEINNDNADRQPDTTNLDMDIV